MEYISVTAMNCRNVKNPARKHSTRNLTSFTQYLKPPRRLRCAVLERILTRTFGIAWNLAPDRTSRTKRS